MKKRILIAIAIICFISNSIIAQWVTQPSGTTALLKSVSAISDQICWVSGAGVVLRTTNTGANWINATGNLPATFGGSNIFGIDGNTAIASGTVSGNAFTYKTTNGGTNWTQVFTQAGGFINSVWMYGALEGFMMGDPVGNKWSLWYSNSIGNAWDSTGYRLDGTGEAGWNNGLYLFGTRIWFTTNTATGKIYYSANSGLTFTAQLTGSTSASYGAISFNGPSNGMASSNDKIFYTSNAGTNWTLLPGLPGTGNVGGITGKNNTWWATRNSVGTSIYVSTNAGVNWVSQTVPSGTYSAIQLARLSFTSPASVWAVGDAGKIVYLSGIVSVKTSNELIPEEFSLSQNYPNPFNPVTKINYQIAKSQSSNVKLIIYNSIGKEIATLVNEKQGAGNYEVEFNGENLSSGLYFYKLEADEFSEVKSMILLK